MRYRANSQPILDLLGQAFYPTAIGAVVLALLVVHLAIGPAVAVFGVYALVGLIGGALVHYGFDDVAGAHGFDVQANWRIDETIHRFGVYVAVLATVGVVALTGQPLAILGGLVVGYTLVVSQLFADPSPGRLLPQLTALFLLSPVTKYLTSGMYIGHSDLLFHTRVVEDLMAGESLQAISYASYFDFPGLHLVASTVGSLSGLGPYDGIMLTGLAVYAILLPAVYLVVVRITEHPMLALWTTVGVALLDDVSFYASYVFPQSLALAMILVLALLATLVSRDAVKWRATGAFFVLAVALSMTHHLTQVLVFPVVVLGLVLYAARGREYVVTILQSRQFPLLCVAVGLSSIRLFSTGFVDRLAAKVGPLISGGARGGYAATTTFGFGRPADSQSVASAIDWLLSPYALYLIVLLLVFSVGVVAFLRATDRPAAQTALFGCGAVGALLVFETPISIQSLIRIRSPWLFVFAFVVGIGLLQMKRFVEPGRRSSVLLALVVLLAATAPMVTADDYYELDPRPTTESSFSDQEVAELEALSGYVANSEESVGTLWLTDKVLQRHGVENRHNPRVEGENVVLPAGHFAYRSAWAGQKVHFEASDGEELYSNSLFATGEWLDQRVDMTNKVYSAGGTGIMWEPTDRSL